MLANKVSPASLCTSAKPSHPESMLSVPGSGTEDSQPSQTSLFNSEPASSMELFSQQSSSSASQHSQPAGHPHHQRASGMHSSQDDSLAVTTAHHTHLPSSQQPQTCGGHNKYYLRYLSTTPASAKVLGKKESSALTCTPQPAEGRQGETAYSMTAFEKWKSQQQERLSHKQLKEEVIAATVGVTKEFSQTLESLRVEIKDTLTSVTTTNPDKPPSETVLHTIISQILQGQAEARQQLTELKALCNQQWSVIASLQEHVATLQALPAAHTALSAELQRLEENIIKPSFGKLESQVLQLSDWLQTHTHTPAPSQALGSREEMKDSGLGGSVATTPCHHSVAIGAVSDHHVPSSVSRSQSRVTQITRKRKITSSGDQTSLSATDTENRGITTSHWTLSATDTENKGNERGRGRGRGRGKGRGGGECGDCGRGRGRGRGGGGGGGGGAHVVGSQSSMTGAQLTPYDLDLTLHSPSHCPRLLSQSLQRLQEQGQGSGGGRRTRSKTAPSRSRLAAVGPLATQSGGVRKRSMERRGRRGLGSTSAGGGVAAPGGRRRSQRNSRAPHAETPVPTCMEEEERVVEDRGRGAGGEESAVVPEETESLGDRTHNLADGDVLNCWLDSPTAVCASPDRPLGSSDVSTASIAFTHLPPPGRFQRSSEAARRRMVVTQQMSSTLASTDSLLKDLLFNSSPSSPSPPSP